MPTWTKEQKQAIDCEGTNILVSAGAGSGKTAVLTERVIRKLKSGIHINELLVLTFTKAAAFEMKERIRSSIEKDPALKEELEWIDGAYITTFDSFALSIVKKYHYLKNITPNVKIAESTLVSLEKKKLLDTIIDSYYEKEDEKFLDLIRTFCTKDDQMIKDAILNMNDKLEMKYDKVSYLENYVATFFHPAKIEADIQKYVEIISLKQEEIKDLLQELKHEVDGDFYETVKEKIDTLIDAKTYDEIKTSLNEISLPRMPKNTSPNASNLKKEIGEVIKEIEELCPYQNEEEIKESIDKTKPYVEILIDILLVLDRQIKDFKEREDLFEFTDIAKLAIQLLEEHSEAQDEVKNTFQEILVDEYQDTSDLQETFISLIQKNNVYMVGDIKQSIYRFRNANPYLFKEKYETYQRNIGGIKIDLNKNFRSREEVLEDINLLFCPLMDQILGGADYKSTHQMIFGNQVYKEKGQKEDDSHMDVLCYTKEKDSLYTKEEMEMFIIAQDIKRKVEEKYLVLDKKTNTLRPVMYQDFVILMDRSTYFEQYKKVFEYQNIPLTIEKEESVKTESDILTLKNMIHLILEIKNDRYEEAFRYAYMSVARSFLIEEKDQNIYHDVTTNQFKNSTLFQKAKEIAEEIEDLTITTLLDRIVDSFSYYECLIKLGSIESAIVRLDYLYNLGKSLEENGYTIATFVTYLDDLFEKGIDLKFQATKESSNSCKMMTIHKSKGLEFPICYFSGLYLKFNMSDIKEWFLYDEKIGFLTPYMKEGISKTIYQALLKDRYTKEEVSEKIRLFYVALTRAKEKMIFLFPKQKEEQELKLDKNGMVKNHIRNKYQSFQTMLQSIEEIITPYKKEIDLSTLPLSKDYLQVKKTNIKEKVGTTNTSFQVTELNPVTKEEQEASFSKKVTSLITKEEEQNINFGREIHRILEEMEWTKSEVDKLDVSPFIKQKLKAFMDQDLIKNHLQANIIREYEFYEEEEDTSYHGIIDLMLEEKEEIIIIDYKLKQIDDENYKRQLRGYQNYIEKKTNKKTSIYLYSIIEEQFQELTFTTVS